MATRTAVITNVALPTQEEFETEKKHKRSLQAYYESWESYIGYELSLGGAQHWGFSNSDTLWPSIPDAIGRMQDKVLSLLELPSGSKVLEAGCGHAKVAINTARNGLRVTAIDCLDYNIERSRINAEKAHLPEGQLQVTKMDYQYLECVPTDSLDGIYTVQALGHATDFDRTFEGFYRTLKPGGKIALIEMERRCKHPGEQAGDAFSNKLKLVNKICVYPGNEATREDFFKESLEKAGFVDVKVRDYSANIIPMWRLCFLLLMIPFFFVQLFGLERHCVTMTAICTGYLGQGRWKFVAVTAKKPGRTLG